MRERLLLVAGFIAGPDMQPNLSYLERRAGLTRGRLKDASRNQSVPKSLAGALVDAAPRLHIEGLTADWLIRGAGRPPRRGGELPPRDGDADRQVAPEPAAKATTIGLAAWLALGAEMQHNLAIDIFKKALEAQDFVGSPVLRAMHGIAQKMDEMGYTAMSRHIWAEMGKYFGQQIPTDEEKP